MNVSLVLITLLVGSFATFSLGDKWASKIALIFSIIAFGLTIFLFNQFNLGVNINLINLWITNPNVYVALTADGLSLTMILLTTILTPLIIFSTFGNNIKNRKSFYGLILFMAFAMTGTFLAADGLLYYIFWELSLIPIYFIALLWGNGDAEDRKKAVVKFFIYTLAGSLFMLIAFVYLYQKSNSFLITDLYKLKLLDTEQMWIFLAFFFAYAIKIPLIPFHSWQANVYQKAPTAGTMLLSGIMLKMGLYSIIRWQLPLTMDFAKQYRYIWISMGIAGVIYGSIVALRQTDMKKLLAYSSLSHVGLIAAGIYTLTPDGLSGAVLQMIAHGFVVVGLFFVAEIFQRRFQTNNIFELGGIRNQSSRFTSMFLLLVLASIGLPLTLNFVGEFTVLYSFSQINFWFALLGGTTIFLSAYYMLKMFQNTMLGEDNKRIFADINIYESIVFVIIIVTLFFFGLFPQAIIDLVSRSFEKIIV